MPAPAHDPFLHQKIADLAATPMQKKLRKLAPMPVGVVFLPWPGMTESEARSHFQLMKSLGFTCLKQTMPTPEWPAARTLALALEEGIYPFWYAEAGFEDITPELLTKLGLSTNLTLDEALAHPKVLAYQKSLFAARIDRTKTGMAGINAPTNPEESAKKKDITLVPGVVGDIKGHELHEDALPHFLEWLKTQYTTVENLKEAWNYRHVGIGDPHKNNWQSWDEVLAALQEGIRGSEYRHLRDALRFRADTYTYQYIHAAVEKQKARDPHEPVRAGGEMGLFLSFASRGTDMEQIASEMADGGSFYPSLHMAWHFEEVDFEVARCVYMQASIAHDWAKGIWSATWESTGGPQYFSGGKAPFVPEAQNKQPGFTTNERTMEHLFFSYLAAGFKGYGLWAWNARTAGWEAGEYALLDRNRKPTPRTVRAGEIGKASIRLKRELWDAHKEPVVGILQDWENEAYWAAMSVTGRDFYKQVPVRARIGASRAFINGNIPWEYVTAKNLRNGLGPRYQCIYVPAFISLSTQLQQDLLDYVKQGGRLVLDMPGAYYDEFGRVYSTDTGSLFEQTFGCILNEFTFGAAINVPYSIDNADCSGFTCVLTPTTAKVLKNFDQHSRPAITEAKVGKGSAVILATQASLNCWKPGNTAVEQLLVKTTLGSIEPPYFVSGQWGENIAYRLVHEKADHYFFINDGPAKQVTLTPNSLTYTAAEDAVSQQKLPLNTPIELPAYGGRWIRMTK